MTPVMAPVQPAVLPPVWTTPQILKAGVAGICAASLLLMGAAIAGARSHRHAMQVVGRDSAPSIVAAEHIRAALADMDASAAVELLAGKDAAAAHDAFERRRTEAISAIVAAAENITFGDSERKPIQQLALGVGTYTAGIQTARDRREITAWREAGRFMDSTLLPAADELDRANRKALDETYDGQKATSTRALVFLVLAGAALGGVLILVQVFLLRRMRRTLNPLLFLATLAAFIFVIYAGQHFGASDRDLKIAKEDAFDSIHNLWQARSTAYATAGDQSRALFDTAQRAVYDRDFGVKAEMVSGFLAEELKNITFAAEGEQQAADETVARFNEYRTSKASSVFQRFDVALDKTLDINQRQFDAAVARGFKDVDRFEISAPVVAFLISFLAWLGLRPRIREYAG